MDKNAIKKYAVWARNELIARVSQKAQQYGITAEGYGDKNADSVNGVLLSATEKKQRQALIAKIDAEGFEQVMEEVAYTWFNRFTALRFMEVNNYLPSHTRVFTNEANEFKPQILTDAISLELDGLDMDRVFELKNANKDEELYKYLLIVQCNALSNILPGMFQKIADYTELLLPDYLLREGSVIEQMIMLIPEDNFDINAENGQIEIIGWLYQYYISEKHEEVVDPLHGKVVKKDEVPAATQLFTTDWVVRYIIDNSIGRYWIERNPKSNIGNELDYFITGNDENVNEQITPQDVTVLDPCIGSGHFAVYAFDVLMKIYIEYGYSEKEAVAEIISNNIFGLDIDGRATQLAYFAVMMKGRQYDRRFFSKGIQPNIFEIKESGFVDDSLINYFSGENKKIKSDIIQLVNIMKNAKEYGSIIILPNIDFTSIRLRYEEIKNDSNLFRYAIENEIMPIVDVAEVLSRKYAVVATNPPYLNKYDEKLKSYIIDNYSKYKGDLFSVFMYHNFDLCKKDGYSGFMTPMVWMFIQTYEELRRYIIENKSIVSLIQMEYSAYEEATVPICSFILKNGRDNNIGAYFRLSDFKGGMQVQKSKIDEAMKGDVDYLFYTKIEKFTDIPGMPIAYWVSDKMREAFSAQLLYDKSVSPSQNITGNNNKYVRKFWELPKSKIGGYDDWIFYCKGGGYRKWWGNLEDVVNWTPQARYTYQHGDGKHASQIINKEYWYKKGITWGLITSSLPSFRVMPEGATYDKGGSTIIIDKDVYNFALGLLNSKIYLNIASMLNPTLNFQVKDVRNMPLIVKSNDEVSLLVERAVEISKEEWDDYETSWEFKKHPFVGGYHRIKDAFDSWKKKTDDRFASLKRIEEEINTLLIRDYGLESELEATVEDKDITLRRADNEADIKSFISYAVGCIFGRYSLDKSGLISAGEEIVESDYSSFAIDKDNIVPISSDDYFDDDIVNLFVKFVETVFGKANLEENLSYIANSLGKNGNAREGIRDYFINGFYQDHVKMYQKKPIYWLFDSGKKNGFKCLMYMHRYHSDTVARIRTDYVHEQQSRYRTALADFEQRISGASTSERVKLNKQLKTIQDQAEELRKYEEKIHHLADQMISIDPDDGVKENYAKFQDVLAKIK